MHIVLQRVAGLVERAKILRVVDVGDSIRRISSETLISYDTTRRILNDLVDKKILEMVRDKPRHPRKVVKIEREAKDKARRFLDATESFYEYIYGE